MASGLNFNFGYLAIRVLFLITMVYSGLATGLFYFWRMGWSVVLGGDQTQGMVLT